MDATLGTAPTAVEIDGLRAEITRLRALVVAQQSKAEQAMRTLSERLHEKADEHDLCEAYDDVIDEVNASLPEGFPRLDARKQTWTVKASYTVEIVREIEATRKDEAVEEFEDEVGRELDTMRDNGDIDDYSLDGDVEAEVES